MPNGASPEPAGCHSGNVRSPTRAALLPTIVPAPGMDRSIRRAAHPDHRRSVSRPERASLTCAEEKCFPEKELATPYT
jgi:hypothetical protein